VITLVNELPKAIAAEVCTLFTASFPGVAFRVGERCTLNPSVHYKVEFTPQDDTNREALRRLATLCLPAIRAEAEESARQYAEDRGLKLAPK
jgi:hypothetical protein